MTTHDAEIVKAYRPLLFRIGVIFLLLLFLLLLLLT